jgi:hypothetical protein
MAGDILATAAGAFMACTVVLCAAGWMGVRRLRRSSTLQRARLVCQRCFSRSSSRRELARLRANVLRATMRSESLMVIVGEQGASAELGSLHERLRRLAAIVDRQLEILSCEADDDALAASLSLMRRRADRVLRAATDLRAAVSLLVEEATDHELDALTTAMRTEVQALSYGRDLLGRSGQFLVQNDSVQS